MRQAASGTMQLVIVSSGLRVISLGTTEGICLFGADETVRSLCRDELMAEVVGGVEEDAGSGGDPSIGRRWHDPKSARMLCIFACKYWFIGAQHLCDCLCYTSILINILLMPVLF